MIGLVMLDSYTRHYYHTIPYRIVLHCIDYYVILASELYCTAEAK